MPTVTELRLFALDLPFKTAFRHVAVGGAPDAAPSVGGAVAGGAVRRKLLRGLLLREDPVSPSVQFGYGGRPPRRPAGAGLGVQVDQAVLERCAVDQASVV